MTGHGSDSGKEFHRIIKLEEMACEYRESGYGRRRIPRKSNSQVRGIKSRVRDMLRRKKRGHTRTSGIPGDLALDHHTAAERRELYISDKRIAVYTALFGDYDTVREPLIHPDNIDYYILTDRDVPEASLWHQLDPEVIPAEYRGDSILCNRWCKMHPDILFPDHELSIYIDANIWVFSDMTPVASGLDYYPVAMFRHKKRRCVYDEVQACIDQNKDSAEALRAHEALLKKHGVPENWGLLEASVIARKHHDERCVSLMDSWWTAFLNNSRRDQISLIDCLWRSSIEPYTIGTLGDNVQNTGLFLQMGHGVSGPRDLDGLLTQMRG